MNPGDFIKTLQTIEQALNDTTGNTRVDEATLADLKTGMANLQQLAEAESMQFDSAKGRFISRAEAKPLRGAFKEWASDVFRAGPIKKTRPLYVPMAVLHNLLKRANSEEDYLELTMGKDEKTLCFMLAAVDKDGKRLDDPDQQGNDVLDQFWPCPQPPCPDDLD